MQRNWQHSMVWRGVAWRGVLLDVFTDVCSFHHNV